MFRKNSHELTSQIQRHEVEYGKTTYRLTSYGEMSRRQYKEAREEALVEALAELDWQALAYIGASYGFQPMCLAEDRTVLALEPIACIFDALRKNILENSAFNVIAIPVGVAPKAGTVEIVHGGHTGATPSFDGAGGSIAETIACIDFANPLFLAVDAAMMDIEGLECEVINQGPPVPENIRYLVIEVHRSFRSEAAIDEMFAKLKAQGFSERALGDRSGQSHFLFER
ncbi:hypothetical protein AB433_00295 [Croceicoccus naphthovorans]|uniref:Methyltransferase FkbM domain-containing protein n=2 Tax=Croceicoccus naphthovorans TaxID=1348774 RepID=A0A0G3XDV2_9SPHN|nr:hypothetical protein AB433_00295 [Croceicoccus naphthovorans]